MIKGKRGSHPNKKTPKKKKGKPGRKSAWDIKIKPRLFEIKGWCRDGYTDKQIAEALDINETTFHKYKKKKNLLLKSLKITKAIADLTVENSLSKRANGFEFDEVTKKLMPVYNEQGKITGYEMQVTQIVTKTLAPETKAIERWLMNRKPKVWRDNRNIKLGGEEEAPTPVKIEFVPVDGTVKKEEEKEL